LLIKHHHIHYQLTRSNSTELLTGFCHLQKHLVLTISLQHTMSTIQITRWLKKKPQICVDCQPQSARC